MVVTLTNELEALVRERVASGSYRNEAEVIADALKLLQERDEAKLKHLLDAIDEGDRDLAEGRYFDVDSERDFEDFLASL